MINRINLILRAKNITARQFAEEIGVQPSGMSHIMSGRNNPSLEFVAKVLRRYPEIDANWLLLGRGEMYRPGGAQPLLPETPAAPQMEEVVDTLFSPLSTPQATPQPTAAEADPEEQYVVEDEVVDVPSERELPQASPAATRRIARLLFIYDDGTFEECLPAGA